MKKMLKQKLATILEGVLGKNMHYMEDWFQKFLPSYRD